MTTVKVWDPVVRLVHWSLAVAFLLNATVIDDDSDWHITVGYVVLGLLAVRLIWGVIGPRHARFSDFPPDLNAAQGHLRDIVLGRRTRHTGHSPLGALMVYNLWVTLALLGLSGWIMTLPESVIGHDPEWAEDLHELFFVWAVASAVLHVVGVAFESLRTRVNLLRAMLTGKKTFDDD